MSPPRPVTVSVDVPRPRTDVYAFLDVMANHEPFTDHMLKDWSYSGPASGVGAKARVRSSFGALSDHADIEVVAAEAPATIVERNVSAKGARVATGTYELTDLPAGGTRVRFTYRWEKAPLPDRVLSPLVRGALRRGNAKAMTRLAERLAPRG
jgi:Polyketide cyclase / dehydrase and lipid transport